MSESSYSGEVQPVFLPRADFHRLLRMLEDADYQVMGPVVEDDAIQYRPIDGPAELPTGVTMQQGPGSFRLENTDSPRWFAWSNGPQATGPLRVRLSITTRLSYSDQRARSIWLSNAETW